MIGFVEDGNFDVAKGHSATVDQVSQAPRGGDNDVDTGTQTLDLSVVRGAAIHGGKAKAERICERIEDFTHLVGKLTSRKNDKSARRFWAAVATGKCDENRNAESKRLS